MVRDRNEPVYTALRSANLPLTDHAVLCHVSLSQTGENEFSSQGPSGWCCEPSGYWTNMPSASMFWKLCWISRFQSGLICQRPEARRPWYVTGFCARKTSASLLALGGFGG